MCIHQHPTECQLLPRLTELSHWMFDMSCSQHTYKAVQHAQTHSCNRIGLGMCPHTLVQRSLLSQNCVGFECKILTNLKIVVNKPAYATSKLLLQCAVGGLLRLLSNPHSTTPLTHARNQLNQHKSHCAHVTESVVTVMPTWPSGRSHYWSHNCHPTLDQNLINHDLLKLLMRKHMVAKYQAPTTPTVQHTKLMSCIYGHPPCEQSHPADIHKMQDEVIPVI